MTEFFLNIPSKVLFGIDVVNRVGSFAEELGNRVLIVTESILYENETIQRVREFLRKKNIQSIIFDEVVPNATSTCVENGIKLARVSRVNLVIGLGGVRALSTAKAIAMAANSKYHIDEYLSGFYPDKDPLPYIEIPTTCRNPFMLRDEYLLTDARNRKAFIGKAQQGITRVILVDPKLSTSLPSKYLTTTLVDTFLTAIEGFISKKSNYLSDSFFLEALKLISEVFKALDSHGEEEELKKILQASTAGCLTALGLTMSQPGLGTAIAYAMNSRLLVPKSWVSVVMLPHILNFNLSACTLKLKHAALLLGESIEGEEELEAARGTILAIQRILGPMNLPSRFRDFDLKLDDLIEVAENAYSFDLINYLPKGVTTEELYTLLKEAY